MLLACPRAYSGLVGSVSRAARVCLFCSSTIEANFHKVKNEAEGLRAKLEAEAAGLRALRDSMTGDGGRNLAVFGPEGLIYSQGD